MKPWFYNEQSITEFKEPVAYKGLEINVRKTNVKPPYIATVKSPATGKEVIQKGGNTEQEALDSAKQAVDKREADAPKISAGGQTSLLFNTPSNDELLKDPSEYNDFYAKISKDQNGPTLVIGNEIYGAADLEADGFRKSGRRNPDKAGEDALPQVAVNASNKTLSQMGIKMNGRYTMDIEGKYEDDKGHTVYPLQFQSSTIHAGDKERMKRPGLTIGMKREDVEPWFQREFEEAEIIKFPEPVKNVVELPNVQSYPDFLTGVKDLHNRRDKGEISQDSHDKLYADLIQRFMRKESFETPWFLRELKADQLKIDVQKAIQSLNPDDPEHVNLLSRLYTTLNKTDYNTRVLQVFSKDKDNQVQKTLDAIGNAFLDIDGSIPEKNEFLDEYEKGTNFVNLEAIASNPGTVKSTADLFNGTIAKRLGTRLITVAGSGYSTGNVGQGEIALASLSRQIRLSTGGKDGGDLVIGKKPVEVKSNEARMFDKGDVDQTGIQTYLQQVRPDLVNANLTVEMAAEMDTADTRTTGERKGWPGEDDEEFWEGLFDVVLKTRYPNVNITPKTFSERIGDGQQFTRAWLQVQFSEYRARAGHEALLLIGPKSFVYAKEGSHLAQNIANYGYIYYPKTKEAREVAIQFKVQ